MLISATNVTLHLKQFSAQALI